MILNKDSMLIKISATAIGSYSGAQAYGEAFIPYEIYEVHEDSFRTLSIHVNDLDGKHSEIEAEVDFEEWTMAQMLTTNPGVYIMEKNELGDNLDDLLIESISYEIGLTSDEEDALTDFNEKLWEIERFYEESNIEICLSKDTEIDGFIVPKGTMIEFKKENKEGIPENWSIELEELELLLREMN